LCIEVRRGCESEGSGDGLWRQQFMISEQQENKHKWQVSVRAVFN